MLPTDVLDTFENVRPEVPVAVALVETVAIEVLLLVTVTVTGLGGVAASEMKTEVSRSRPTLTFEMLMLGAVTVAVICWLLLGVEKPAGVPIVRMAVPTATGWKAVVTKFAPPPNTTGLDEIV